MIATVAALLISATAPKPKLLVLDTLILGEYVSGKWRHVPDKYEKTFGTTVFRLIELGRIGKTVTAKKALYEEVTGGSYVDLPDKGGKPSLTVAVSNMAPSLPRPVRNLPQRSATYLRFANEFLRANNLPNTSKLENVIVADLDGDGTDEVLLEGRNFSGVYEPLDEKTALNSYSFVIMRYLSGSKVKTHIIEFYSGKQKGWTPPLKQLRAIADLEGDGVMEIITGEDYHEGGGGSLWRFGNGNLTRLLYTVAGV